MFGEDVVSGGSGRAVIENRNAAAEVGNHLGRKTVGAEWLIGFLKMKRQIQTVGLADVGFHIRFGPEWKDVNARTLAPEQQVERNRTAE